MSNLEGLTEEKHSIEREDQNLRQNPRQSQGIVYYKNLCLKYSISFYIIMDESNISERGIGQRGPDRKPRAVNPKSLSNLKQFQKPVSEANLSVNSGVNWSKLGKIAIVVIVFSAIIWKLYQRKKNSESSTDNDETNLSV